MTVKQGIFCSVWTGNDYQDLTFEEWGSYDLSKLGRSNGPTIVYEDGAVEWLLGGKLHRTDGPALIHTDGTQEWWQNDKQHKIDGPAIVWYNGSRGWFLNGKVLDTLEVETWIQENSIDLSTEEGQAAFILRWS